MKCHLLLVVNAETDIGYGPAVGSSLETGQGIDEPDFHSLALPSTKKGGKNVQPYSDNFILSKKSETASSRQVQVKQHSYADMVIMCNC